MNLSEKASGKELRMKKKSKLKILHVGNHTYPCVGGIEQVIWTMAREQAREGHAVEVLVYNTCSQGKENLPEKEEVDGVTIHRIPFTKIGFYRWPSVMRIQSFLRGKDIVHVHGLGGWTEVLLIARKESHTQFVLTTHGLYHHTQNRKGWKSLYTRFILPLVIKKMDKVFLVSENEKKYFSNNLHEKLCVIPNGIDFEKWSTVSIRKKKPSTLIFVGRLSKNKRVDRLIDVIHNFKNDYPGIRLHIVGEDWEGLRNGLEALAKKWNVENNVTFHGKISDEKLRDLYRQSDIVISASEYEGFGISIVEAMAAGCVPCINDIPTFRLFAGEKRGVVVDFSNTNEVVHSLELLLQTPSEKFVEMRKKCRAYAKEYSLTSVVGRTLLEYEKLLTLTKD